MIPPFDDSGYLPPGVHAATLDEVAVRFGRQSEVRQVQMESIHWLVELVKRIGAERLIINGSFVTDKLEPNDVDCVVLLPPQKPQDREAEAGLRAGLPFLEIALVRPRAFTVYVETVFATDRHSRPKGMVEVIL